MEPTYKGNSVFRNQPSYKYFNKPADDPKDFLNLHLNEIDPYFLTESLELENKEDNIFKDIIDPRTKKPQKRTFVDFSDQRKKHKIFYGNKIKSSINKAVHVVCLRVLHSWQQQIEVFDKDVIVYRRVEGKIKKEQEEMLSFVRESTERNKEAMYEPTKRLDNLYRNWYKTTLAQILKRYPDNVAFNTFTGLPHASVCKSFIDEKVEFADVKLIIRKGWVRLVNLELDWRNLNFRLDNYAEEYIKKDDQSSGELQFEEKLKNELEEFGDQSDRKNFCIPFDTILFLLTAGDYVDLPTDVLLEIRNNSTNEDKIVIFDKPFPARNCGWHTQQKMIEQAFTEFVAVKGRCKWIYVDKEKFNVEHVESGEIHAINKSSIKFSPKTTEEYFEENHSNFNKLRNKKKDNAALIEWHLKNQNTKSDFKILTTLQLPSLMDEKTLNFLPCELIKLEYKPQFGCELMTKYELLRAWLQMQLMSFSKCEHNGFCYRISALDYELQLAERLTLEAVELYLNKNYYVNTTQLFSNLSEFLKLLSNMPTGKYLLRYNAKYKDKFLLCTPAKEISQNTIFLHNLLNAEPNNMAFMTQQYFLPISDSLCSVVHLHFKVLPCAFLPMERHHKNLEYFSNTINKKTKTSIDNSTTSNNDNVITKDRRSPKQGSPSKKRKRKSTPKKN